MIKKHWFAILMYVISMAYVMNSAGFTSEGFMAFTALFLVSYGIAVWITGKISGGKK